ncbi:glycine zipper family protein [Streptomyces sp. NBC_01142]|uniref:general stress protein n=1 Tax=Streptomyces sp. NBC_01142 TaxID=2975865 RepID=UPI002257E161|nr:general stress protein [Streptomyces sp. NBC_01142]MCX4825244.1 glycine zipper family protein [Streptomyces sp. NBC_01142]
MDERNRRTIASYATYAEAERAVDYLSDQGFPVERVTIIGHDLRIVERVVGRLNYGKAALSGAASGALPGVLIGWLFGLFNWLDPVVSALLLALYGLIFGAVVGALLGLLMYAMQRGRRDFASVSAMQPGRYEVVTDTEVADRAVGLLDQLGIPETGKAAAEG